MPLHEKRYDPTGKLVVAKRDGLKFGGRLYNYGEEITDPICNLRKKRQLYFQNKLAYDYEIDEARANRARQREITKAIHAAALNSPLPESAPAPIVRDQATLDREAALVAQAEAIREQERIAEDAELAKQKAAYLAKFPDENKPQPETTSEPASQSTPAVEPAATPAEAVSEAPVVVESPVVVDASPVVTEPEVQLVEASPPAEAQEASASVDAPRRRRVVQAPAA